MRRAFFFIGVLLFAGSSFASIPRASMLDDALLRYETSSETRIGVSDVLAPFEQPVPSLLSRALHQAYEQASTTSASGLAGFLSVDPVLNLKRALREPQNWNRYAYVMNNPLKYTDPTGKDVSIRLGFTGDSWTDEQKRKIIAQVTQWYQKQNVGKVYVFDGAKASHGGNFFTRLFSGGYTSINVSSGTGTKHTPSTVFAGNYGNLSAAQRINAISNSIIHETAAHHFRATAGNQADQMFFARDSGYRSWDSVRQRYGTVADSYSFADPATRANVTEGPIPIHPDDQKALQNILRDEHVEPPDYEP